MDEEMDIDALRKHVTGLTEVVQHLIASVTALEQWRMEVQQQRDGAQSPTTAIPQEPMEEEEVTVIPSAGPSPSPHKKRPRTAESPRNTTEQSSLWNELERAMTEEVAEWEAKVHTARQRTAELKRRWSLQYNMDLK